MTEFEIEELEEMFKRRCTQRYQELIEFKEDNHDSIYRIIYYCYDNYANIKDIDDLRKVVMDIDEYYWYSDNFTEKLMDYCDFLKLYKKFISKYRAVHNDEDDMKLHYYTYYDDEYFNAM